MHIMATASFTDQHICSSEQKKTCSQNWHVISLTTVTKFELRGLVIPSNGHVHSVTESSVKRAPPGGIQVVPKSSFRFFCRL